MSTGVSCKVKFARHPAMQRAIDDHGSCSDHAFIILRKQPNAQTGDSHLAVNRVFQGGVGCSLTILRYRGQARHQHGWLVLLLSAQLVI